MPRAFIKLLLLLSSSCQRESGALRSPATSTARHPAALTLPRSFQLLTARHQKLRYPTTHPYSA